MRVSEEFKNQLSSTSPLELAEKWINNDTIHAFSNAKEYVDYLELILNDYPESEKAVITGSGNWCYSLNPKKNFSKFHKGSDIDVSIVSEEYFSKTWEELRLYHRENYYLIGKSRKDDLNRNGQNVYSGFVTPKWIPNKKSKTRFQYEINVDKYSNKHVDYRAVNMMFFKNNEEMADYYIRGIRIAQSRLKNYGI